MPSVHTVSYLPRLPSSFSFSFFLRYVFDDFNIALETCEDLILAQHAADLKTEVTVVRYKDTLNLYVPGNDLFFLAPPPY